MRSNYEITALLKAARVLAAKGRVQSARDLREGHLIERIGLAIATSALPRPVQRDGAPVSSSIRVAALLDEFSANSFDGSFDAVHVTPDLWREQFEEHRPDIFFCESAWSGRDSILRPWKGKIYSSILFPRENRTALLEILAHCKASGIPTVFWNKEDPSHYTDRVHDFVKTAAAFDSVFTSAVECVDGYRNEYGLKNVHALAFATNPSLFNPVEMGTRTDNIVFAGSWYANHLERSRDMATILDNLVASGHSLEIFDRYFHDDDPLHKWPAKYQKYVFPPVPHNQIAGAYKSSRLALNINTVTASRTMFARRVFELASSNTLVLSNYSLGVEEMFGDDVIFCDRDPHRLRALGDAEIDAMRERNLDRVLTRHTYRHRWEEMLSAIGIGFRSAKEAITVVWPVRGDAYAQAGITWFQQEADLSRDKLLLMITEEVTPLEIARLYERFNRFGVTVTSLSHAEDLSIDGHYIPIETSHVAIMSPDDLPEGGWLSRARKHLQYADNLLLQPNVRPGARYSRDHFRRGATRVCSLAALAQLPGHSPDRLSAINI